MSDYHQWDSIQSVTPTLCEILNISSPSLTSVKAHQPVIQAAKSAFNFEKAEKCLVFAPDALGFHLHGQYANLFDKVRQHAPVEIPVKSVMPSVTPVCFASMFTGAAPSAHGITKYEKPVLTCDTIFDTLIRHGKKVAIVAVKDCSIDRIFRNRSLDYYSEVSDADVIKTTQKLIQQDTHDFILTYVQEYDDMLHETSPFAEAAIQGLQYHVEDFITINQAVLTSWSKYNFVVAFTPDHGAHFDEQINQGNHGEDIPEDMEIIHFYGFHPKTS